MNIKSFTLVEVLIVVVIIGILSSLIYIGIGTSAEKAQDSKIVKNLDSLNKKLLSYYNLSGTFQYPKGETCIENTTTNTFLVSALGLDNLPTLGEYDEDTKACYFYQSNGDDYSITVKSPNGGYILADSKTTQTESPKSSSDCESGWIPFGNRCIMKYEAKIQGNDNGNQTYNSSFVAESRESGTPWVNMSQVNAKAECEAIGAHLMTNPEWMALAHDIELTASNWSGGVVGSGYINRGNSDGSSALDGTSVLTGINKRTHTLSNGEIIWDIAGNVWDWVDEEISCASSTCTENEMPYGTTSGSEWCEFNGTVSGYDTISKWGEFNKYQLAPIGNYNSTYGVGRAYTDNTVANPSGNIHGLMRGGRYGNTSSAGIYALAFDYAPTTAYDRGGFRCVK